jgi:hypothetical protein
MTVDLNWKWEQFAQEIQRQIGWDISLAQFGRNRFEANQLGEDGKPRTLAAFAIGENMVVTVVSVARFG